LLLLVDKPRQHTALRQGAEPLLGIVIGGQSRKDASCVKSDRPIRLSELYLYAITEVEQL
jgi:hypothetical protein